MLFKRGLADGLGKNKAFVIVEKGKREPDRYHFGFGLDLRAWTAQSLIDYLKEIPKDAVWVDVKWREQFKDGRLFFEVNNGKRIP